MALLKCIYLFLFSLLFCYVLRGQTASGIVNDYRKVRVVDTAKGIIRLVNASNCTQYIGHSVLLIQMKGASIDASNSASFGNITAINNAGKFELGRMCGQLGDSIVLENKIQNMYDSSGLVQLVFMPLYNNITINGTLMASPWDPVAGTGGIVAIEAAGTVTLNADVSADSAGFRGGALQNQSSNCSNTIFAATAYYYDGTGTFQTGAKKGEGIADYITGKEYGKGKQSNGGGGGNNANNGGGGGSNYAAGGVGGNKTSGCNLSNPGIGGTALSSSGYSLANFRVFLGGGGGAGHENDNVGTPGGHGGGLVFIKAATIINAGGKITANGSVGYNPANTADVHSSISDGGGGGGAGGTILLQVNNFTNALPIEAKGGKGCDTEVGGTALCAGPGGGGSGGFVWLTPAVIPGNISIDVSSGTNGVVRSAPCLNQSNGATAGGAGSFSGGFAFPALKDSSPICKQILPPALISAFDGMLSGKRVFLTLTLVDALQAQDIFLQFSADCINFTDIARKPGGALQYPFTDEYHPYGSYYRAKVLTITSATIYSRVVYFKPSLPAYNMRLFPNPVKNSIRLNIEVPSAQVATINIYTVTGALMYKKEVMLISGVNNIVLRPVLQKSVYTLQLITGKNVLNRVFVHQ